MCQCFVMILCIALVHLGLADPDRKLMDKPPEGKHDVFLGNSQLRASNIFRTVFTSLIGLIWHCFFFGFNHSIKCPSWCLPTLDYALGCLPMQDTPAGCSGQRLLNFFTISFFIIQKTKIGLTRQASKIFKTLGINNPLCFLDFAPTNASTRQTHHPL